MGNQKSVIPCGFPRHRALVVLCVVVFVVFLPFQVFTTKTFSFYIADNLCGLLALVHHIYGVSDANFSIPRIGSLAFS